MAWWGKIVGGAFGFMAGGPLGAALGAAVGHSFDRGVETDHSAALNASSQEQIQATFFTATFSVMGHVAKADGRVSEDEIKVAEALMSQMALTTEQRRVARDLFNQGKRQDFDLDAVLDQFRHQCGRQRNLLQMFLEVQLHAAYADGHLHAAEARIVNKVATQLGFSSAQLKHLEALVRGQRNGASANQRSQPSNQFSAAEAYAILGVARSASDAEVKKAYRRLMSQHHPDKLVAKGLPEEMITLATAKTQEIKAAYESIKAARKT